MFRGSALKGTGRFLVFWGFLLRFVLLKERHYIL